MAKATVVIHNSPKQHIKQEDILCVVKFRGRNINEVNGKVAALKGQLDGAWQMKVVTYP